MGAVKQICAAGKVARGRLHAHPPAGAACAKQSKAPATLPPPPQVREPPPLPRQWLASHQPLPNLIATCAGKKAAA